MATLASILPEQRTPVVMISPASLSTGYIWAIKAYVFLGKGPVTHEKFTLSAGSGCQCLFGHAQRICRR